MEKTWTKPRRNLDIDIEIDNDIDIYINIMYKYIIFLGVMSRDIIRRHETLRYWEGVSGTGGQGNWDLGQRVSVP